ncbi:GNAT family N-acetyltransferase [Methanobacterium sp. ACI-7]|uniref:GNAT family N-acetyltransferase n=1 Tax=unclassified Methanobacterium TaxID=2627676 RepID=UPI0039C3C71C
MQIRRMEDKDLASISKIDHVAFGHGKPRSIENLKVLKLSDPEGCFVLEDNGVIIGYNFSKSIGNEGYLGPLGILPEYQNSGYGKALILKNIEYLKEKCDVIGLEVLPELGENIGLYQKMGFVSCLPSLRFKFPNKLNSNGSNYEYLNLNGLNIDKIHGIIDKIDKWSKKEFNGASYKKDILSTLELKGRVLVAFKNENPVAFITYSNSATSSLGNN